MNFNFKKKYGQNFLKDKLVIKRIANSIDPKSDDLIIEIGPGSGTLTEELLKSDSRVLAYEIDSELKKYLDVFSDQKLDVIYDDFLKRDISEDIKKYNYNNLYIMGNLPYYITTPIIKKIIDSRLDESQMVFMVQKEVAERLSAHPGTHAYGSITVFLNCYYDVSKIIDVNRDKFIPEPNVDSAVISLRRKNVNYSFDEQKFSKIVSTSFKFKRKNLRNNFKGYNLDLIEDILKKHSFSLANRAEDLPLEVFIDIANSI